MIDPESSSVAIIPARGGSKGIPGKNLIDVAGKPLIGWTLEACVNAATSLRVVVSTDSKEIAKYAVSSGAEVVQRPSDLATDASPTEPGIIHALDTLGIQDTQVVLLLQPTSPIRSEGLIDSAHERFISAACDSLVAVVEESPFLWRGSPSLPHAEYNVRYRRRRQEFLDEERVYRESGSLYVFRAGSMRSSGNRIDGRSELIVQTSIEGIDVDTKLDLFLARAVLQAVSTGEALI